MSGVYIKGMEMPDCGYVGLKVFANGEVLMTKIHRGALVITGIKDKVGTAVPVPPHGDLIDIDETLKHLPESYGKEDLENVIATAPTIIPADKEDSSE